MILPVTFLISPQLGIKKLLVLAPLTMAPMLAAPPTCEIKGDIEVCERTDQNCEQFVAEHFKSDPSRAWMENWRGCLWPATILKGHSHLLGPAAPITGSFAHVTVVTSYTDSERFDMTVDVELRDHKHRKFEFKGEPVIILGGVPCASVNVSIELGSQLSLVMILSECLQSRRLRPAENERCRTATGNGGCRRGGYRHRCETVVPEGRWTYCGLPGATPISSSNIACTCAVSRSVSPANSRTSYPGFRGQRLSALRMVLRRPSAAAK